MVHTYNEILFSCLKKEENPAISHKVDGPGGPHAKLNQAVTERQILQDSTDMRSLKESNSQKQKVELWLPLAEGRGKRRLAVQQE